MNGQRKCGTYTLLISLDNQEKWNIKNCPKMDGSGYCYIKLGPDSEQQILHIFLLFVDPSFIYEYMYVSV